MQLKANPAAYHPADWRFSLMEKICRKNVEVVMILKKNREGLTQAKFSFSYTKWWWWGFFSVTLSVNCSHVVCQQYCTKFCSFSKEGVSSFSRKSWIIYRLTFSFYANSIFFHLQLIRLSMHGERGRKGFQIGSK